MITVDQISHAEIVECYRRYADVFKYEYGLDLKAKGGQFSITNNLEGLDDFVFESFGSIQEVKAFLHGLASSKNLKMTQNNEN